LKIVLLSEVFSKRMGYLGNILPKYLAKLGAEVHLVTMDLPPYYHLAEYQETLSRFSDERNLVAGSVQQYQGFTLHVLPHRKRFGHMRKLGLSAKLKSLAPDIVQTMTCIGWNALSAALCKPFGNYELFTGAHMTSSVFTLAQRKASWWSRDRLRCSLQRSLPGRVTSLFTRKCYAATEDCATVAVDYFGVQKRKVEVMYLGVDTEYFFPVSTELHSVKRTAVRRKLGFSEDDIVCIYTGKFTSDKKVHLLLKAVEQLRSHGLPFRALFIGEGPQGRELARLSWSTVLPFMPFQELGPFYRAADIAVWPGNESTSMLDAAACGLPLVISDEVFYRAPVDGNGKVFRQNDSLSLSETLLELSEAATRTIFGSAGALRMAREFSWECIAKRRLLEYEAALRVHKPFQQTLPDQQGL
jgi:glycosyltransferase involved in cell wall biosynthesis